MKTITNYTRYLIDRDGDIYSTITNKFLKKSVAAGGYEKVTLRDDYEQSHTFLVHRLVWEVFNGPIPDGMTINHKSEIKKDNRLENLELMTLKDNCNYGTRNQRISAALKLRHKELREFKETLQELKDLVASAPSLDEDFVEV
jgi:hypothetical protein